ncbi:ADP-ribosylglycohydrolase family protein [Leifsonia sp. NPDC058248]|uniref:ADP-ribosylglycohydrolase family protein n=1 Tax=Leifsonia sp. NPDC058248 TaxID=3346402 RepID=UPI0036DE6939
MAGGLQERAHALLLAAAAGDALGWPQEDRGGLVGGKRARLARRPDPEFSSWQRNSGSRYARYQETVEAGAYSDDTQLMFAVARSCLVSDDWERYFTSVELPAWPTYQRGGGRAVLSAANSWGGKVAPWHGSRSGDTQSYFEAGANGVAMRIGPHVIWAAARGLSLEQLLERIVRDGITTHGHPRALIGAMCFGTALAFALKTESVVEPESFLHAAEAGLIDGRAILSFVPQEWVRPDNRASYVEKWNRVNAEMYALLATARRSLRQGSMSNVTATLSDLGAIGKYSGSGTASAAAAIYLASRAGTRPISGLLQAAFEHGADTDTLASMTGALLGAVHGAHWLGRLRDVQDAPYIARVASALVEGVPMLPPVGRISSTSLYRELDQGTDAGIFVDGRAYLVLGASAISESPDVTRFRLGLEDGQSVIVDRLRRNSRLKEHSAPQSAGSPVSKLNAAERKSAIRSDASSGGLNVFISLTVGDLQITSAFYEDILGVTLERDGRSAWLTDEVRFEAGQDSDTLSLPDARITLSVDDLGACAKRIGQNTRETKERGMHIQLIDPDGRAVTIIQSR